MNLQGSNQKLFFFKVVLSEKAKNCCLHQIKVKVIQFLKDVLNEKEVMFTLNEG